MYIVSKVIEQCRVWKQDNLCLYMFIFVILNVYFVLYWFGHLKASCIRAIFNSAINMHAQWLQQWVYPCSYANVQFYAIFTCKTRISIHVEIQVHAKGQYIGNGNHVRLQVQVNRTKKKWIFMYEYKRMVRLKGHQIRISNHVRLQVQINWTRKDRYPCTDTLNCNTKT
jgi:hypothetical protein